MTTEPLNAKTRRPRASLAVTPVAETETTPLLHMKKALAQLQAGRQTPERVRAAGLLASAIAWLNILTCS
ncbi:hypothetical protein [Achromobacter ruhlandii]|uniref:hypothetical protein n=1 Tax=Achromobacter ruhlandii TaxID=72557 RepID=UPI001EEE73C4|nr:hypothetical protein [Achromobacter ruhlandii]MCZ8398886.1 hypothetical protein [Achromobacter ruhlandii]MEB6665183.1 hypothetical protein [Achromobacter ruhlandii]